MAGGQNETPVRLQTQPGLDYRYATAAGIQKIAHPKGQRHSFSTLYRATHCTGDPLTFFVQSRVPWTLERLRVAVKTCCTRLTQATRPWNPYVFDLRKASLKIEMLHEPNQGPYPGPSGRYVLRSNVRQFTAMRQRQIARVRILFSLTCERAAGIAAFPYGECHQ